MIGKGRNYKKGKRKKERMTGELFRFGLSEKECGLDKERERERESQIYKEKEVDGQREK